MTIVELEAIEKEETVTFSLNGKGRLEAEGTEGAVNRAIGRIAGQHVAVAAILRERQGLPEPGEAVVTREISLNVLSKAVYRANYIAWFSGLPAIYHRTPEDLDLMFAQVNEGDEVVFDFSDSFTVRRPDGLLQMIDARGKIHPPSPYSPAMRGK